MKKAKKKITVREKDLMRRYLIWCYKTTREELDRIDRKFTQLRVDYHVLSLLSRNRGTGRKQKENACFKKVDEFKQYIANKEKGAFSQKFSDKKGNDLKPDYWYLENRLAAIEQAVCDFLGPAELKKIRALYEKEMTRRILEAREHTC